MQKLDAAIKFYTYIYSIFIQVVYNIDVTIFLFSPYRTTTVSVKMVGTLWGLLVPSMLVYKIWWPNRDKQLWEGRGEHENGKNSVWLKCPNYFCLRL